MKVFDAGLREEVSSTRRRVLDAAARLVLEDGFDAVTLVRLSQASGVSNGSIYHHFGSKDGVLASVLTEIVQDFHRCVLAALDHYPDDAHAGVLGAVGAHLSWTEQHRDQALLLQRYRERVARGPEQRRISELNRDFRNRSTAWLHRQAEAGRLPVVTAEVGHALVFAPAAELCRVWLTKHTFPAPTTFTAVLGEAAWAALRTLPSQARPRENRTPDSGEDTSRT